jgi:hypothetical protein
LVENQRIGQQDLFEILGAVEDYVANDSTLQKGSDLLIMALHAASGKEGGKFGDWRDLVPHESTSEEILDVFRQRATIIIGQLYTTN